MQTGHIINHSHQENKGFIPSTGSNVVADVSPESTALISPGNQDGDQKCSSRVFLPGPSRLMVYQLQIDVSVSCGYCGHQVPILIR
jgi:hypothetical protein